nr:GDSL esterase/lipase At5g33370-like [Ipomoea batatas]GME18468.1 GDSL esterase/lipase At5g33370-like [Ipomoea batatas]GME19156.1 GDSL esterase/lipase At5g33370-like [Ipomoea batatas]
MGKLNTVTLYTHMGAAAVPFFVKFAVIFGLSAAFLAADVAEGRRAFFVFGDSLVDNAWQQQLPCHQCPRRFSPLRY